jgi:hypothetical protein
MLAHAFLVVAALTTTPATTRGCPAAAKFLARRPADLPGLVIVWNNAAGGWEVSCR